MAFLMVMHHLIYYDEIISTGGPRTLKKNAKQTLEKVAQIVKQNLNPNEIFVLGEDEAVPSRDACLAAKVFEKAGFKYHSTNKDEMGESLNYVYENFRLFSGE